MPDMEMPVFALHTVPFPGMSMGLRVFEPRYLALVDHVLPAERFAVVAIKRGAEVGGSYEANQVAVAVSIAAHTTDDDGTRLLDVLGEERIALVEQVRDDPYPVWRAEAFPDEGGAGTDDVEAAVAEMRRYLDVTGLPTATFAVPHEPVAASYALAAATPGSTPERQALLETAGAGERLAQVRAIFRREASIVKALGATAGSASLHVDPN